MLLLIVFNLKQLIAFNLKQSPQDFEILGWCSAGPVLPHGEKVPL